MTVTIPRTELDAIGARYGVSYLRNADVFDLSVEHVRALAAELRGTSAGAAEAADLDALVDRIEREAGA